MNEQAPVSAKHRTLPRWFPEVVLVVVSVALGFGVARYGEYTNDRQLKSRVLDAIWEELERNHTALEPMVPFHRTWVHALNEAAGSPSQSGIDVWFATRPPLPDPPGTPFATLRRSAWDAAIAGGSLRLLDYEVTSALSELYRAQDILEDNIDRLASGALSQTATYDPSSSQSSIRLLWLTLADIHAAEAMLLALYQRHLPLIQEAAQHATQRR